MGVTPEQILNKVFTVTQFRQGYERNQVDDFLDEVVTEMRAVLGQRDDYLHQLNECRAGRDLPALVTTDDAAADASSTEIESLRSQLADLEARATDAESRAQAAQERAEAAESRAEAAEARAAEVSQAPAALGDGGGGDEAARLQELASSREAELNDCRARLAECEETTTSLRSELEAAQERASHATTADAGAGAAGVIALAQRLHDEHVRKGEETRDGLISEAQNRHDELVGTAQARHDELITTAQNRHDELLGTAQARHDELINAGQSRHDELVGQGQQQHDDLVAQARKAS